MRNAADAPPCDGCDRKLTNASTPGWSERQRRFLDAYRQRPTIAPAARLAGVHRATVYRWLADAAFADALRAAAEVFFQETPGEGAGGGSRPAALAGGAGAGTPADAVLLPGAAHPRPVAAGGLVPAVGRG